MTISTLSIKGARSITLTKQTIKRVLPIFFVALGSVAHAQYLKEHGVSISVGATAPFDRELTSSPISGVYTIATPTGGVTDTTISGQQEFTTNSVGFLSSIQLHPKPWAGVELNYGFQHYSERYEYNQTAANTAETLSISTDVHEFTGAYQFHPKHIPFQPFVNVGGGALDFTPRTASNQIRGAGLMEAGFDVPAYHSHIGFRFEGRGLFYRAPNYYDSAISTHEWRATIEPSVSTYYRF